MVKQLRATLKEQAENLGFTNFPMYTFYGQPQGLKQETWKVKPKFVNSILEWMKSSDPSVEESSPGQSLRTIFFYLLAPQLGVFVKVAPVIPDLFHIFLKNPSLIARRDMCFLYSFSI